MSNRMRISSHLLLSSLVISSVTLLWGTGNSAEKCLNGSSAAEHRTKDESFDACKANRKEPARIRAILAFEKRLNQRHDSHDAAKAFLRVFKESTVTNQTLIRGRITGTEPTHDHFTFGQTIHFGMQVELEYPSITSVIFALAIICRETNSGRKEYVLTGGSTSTTTGSDFAAQSDRQRETANCKGLHGKASEGEYEVTYLVFAKSNIDADFALLDSKSFTYIVKRTSGEH